MAINPEIALGVRTPPVSNPLEGIEHALTMRDLLQRGELTRQNIALGQENIRRVKLEGDEKQRQLDADQAQQDAIKTHTKLDPDDGSFTIDHPAVEAAIIRAGYPERALTYNKTRKEIEDNAYNMAIHQLELGSKRAEQIGKLATSVLNAAPELQPSLYSAAVRQAVDRGLATPVDLEKYGLTPQWDPQKTPAVLQQMADAASNDPYGDLLKRMQEKRAADKFKEELPGVVADTKKKLVDLDESKLKLAESQQKQESQLLAGATDQTSWDNALAQLGEDRRKIYPAQFSESARKAAFWAGVGPDARAQIENTKNEVDLAERAASNDPAVSGPAKKAFEVLKRFQGDVAAAKESARVAAEMGVLGGAAGTTPAGQVAVASQGGRNEDMMMTLSPETAGVIRGMVDYKIPLPGGMALRSPYWQRMLQLAVKYDPSFDVSQYPVRQRTRLDFTSGRASQNIRSLNTVTKHLDELDKAIKNLNNFSGDSILPTMANYAENLVFKKKAQARFGAAVNAVANELTAAFRGQQGAEADIRSWKQQFGTSSAQDVQKEGVNEVAKLMSGRIEAMYDQYEKAMGKPADFNILDKGARETLRRLGVNPDEVDPPKGTAAASSAPVAKYKIGDVVTVRGQKVKITKVNDDGTFEGVSQ